MNQEQAKAWLPLIQAVADGKMIQVKSRNAGWVDINEISGYFSTETEFLRIKPKKYQCRIFLIQCKTGKYGFGVCHTNDEEDEVQSYNEFVRWLTDRIEYELPEGE